ncbi:hypothetical protein AAFF_G00170160 [Aldrovandia affinis]|uniref:Uncharacterized protein n=1 Tax=Aldrovandia affinis TaxID=143900 RepID=A0AAD7W6Z3_9TELE|nr:hypothetical protein AAFF_G00170160 [Aldrovandia affinis]
MVSQFKNELSSQQNLFQKATKESEAAVLASFMGHLQGLRDPICSSSSLWSALTMPFPAEWEYCIANSCIDAACNGMHVMQHGHRGAHRHTAQGPAGFCLIGRSSPSSITVGISW